MTVALWCRCGGSMTASTRPAGTALRLADIWRDNHTGEGCELTDDPEAGRKWRAAALRRERRAS
jgi:hypothetical protein